MDVFNKQMKIFTHHIFVLCIVLSSCATLPTEYSFEEIVTTELENLSQENRRIFSEMSFSKFISNLYVQQWQFRVISDYHLKDVEVLSSLGYPADSLYTEAVAEDVVVGVFNILHNKERDSSP